MISGALLLDPRKKEDLRTFYAKRLSRILAPILFRSAFFLLWSMMKGVVKGNPPSAVDLLKRILAGTPYFHMWFLYMIATLYLFTPFFRRIVAGSTRPEIAFLVFAIFLMVVVNAVWTGTVPRRSGLFINLFLPYVPYFFLGHWIRTDERDPPKSILWAVFLLSWCLTAFGRYGDASHPGLASGLYGLRSASVTVIPMSVSVMYLLKFWTRPIANAQFTGALARLTLGIYLIHPIALDAFRYLGFGPLDSNAALSIPVLAGVAYASSCAASWLIHRVPYLARII
jgi:surface polysaccharide O-acyltransferase-like enzyme